MAEIPLHGKHGAGRVTLIDDEDLPLVSGLRWIVAKYRKSGHWNQGYAISWLPREGGKRRCVYMHRLVMKEPAGLEVDHVDPRFTLDNRKANLRVVDHPTNVRNAPIRRDNKSGYRGVHFSASKGRWAAEITSHGVWRHLGRFSTPEEASAAYEAARASLGLLKATVD